MCTSHIRTKVIKVEDKFYDELEHVLLENFNAILGRVILKSKIRNESLHEIINDNDNGLRVANFATSNTMFPHSNMHKYTWDSPDGKSYNQSDHILIDKRRYSSVVYVRYFRGAVAPTIIWRLQNLQTVSK